LFGRADPIGSALTHHPAYLLPESDQQVRGASPPSRTATPNLRHSSFPYAKASGPSENFARQGAEHERLLGPRARTLDGDASAAFVQGLVRGASIGGLEFVRSAGEFV
jgi:hypothetical protein